MKSLKYLFAFTILVLGLAGCTYNFIVPEEIPVIDPDDPNAEQVSYSEQIQPIFNTKCIVCHNGSRNPNLSSGNSFTSLSSGYINLTTAEESLIYTKPNPTAGGSHIKYSALEAALVLGWIKQGAKNN